jgi:imidazole glycerol-phosphate synthase subunit HisH
MTVVQLIDYGVGNIKSLTNAITKVGFETALCQRPDDIDPGKPIILPGVGSFAYCKHRLIEAKLFPRLHEVLHNERPVCFIGICVGMQLLFQQSDEDGRNSGFGYFNGTVESLRAAAGRLTNEPPRFPNTHWHPVSGIRQRGPYYFTHSFGNLASNDRSAHYALSAMEITAIASRGTVAGFQFHPEKSAEQGLTLLRQMLTTGQFEDHANER